MRSTSQRSCWPHAFARANAREQVLQAILSVGQALVTPSQQIRAISHEESEQQA